MKSRFAGLAGLLAFLLLEVHAVPTADACGVKLTVKTSAPRKAIARTSNPSRVLLVGSPPRRLERDLSAAGHKVDAAPNPDAAKRDDYSVVIVDNSDQASSARSKYPDAKVLVRSDDVGKDLKSVESQVGRTLVASKERDRAGLVGARTDRQPIAAGPAQPDAKPLVAAKAPSDTPPPAETPPPERVATAAPTRPEPTPEPVKPEPRITAKPERVETPRTAKAAATSSSLREEVHFSVGSARVPNASRVIARTAKWLNANPDVRVSIEGHADPTGTPEGNMTLSQIRADKVKDSLVERGVDGSRIDVNAYGDTQLKYGARDGRNRRVSIEATK